MKKPTNSGFSLVQMLVVMGIGSVLVATMVTMQANQARENQGLTEKLAVADLQNQMIRVFADGTVCTNLMTTATPLTFDSTNAVAGNPNQPFVTVPGRIPGPYIPVSAVAGAPALATAGTRASATSTSVVIATANPFQVIGLVGTNDGTTGTYTGNFQINLDMARLVRPLRPPSVQVTLKTATAGTTQTVTSCQMSASGNCWVQGPGGLTTTTCGNVGIGTVNPNYILETVSDAAQIASRATVSTFYSGGGPHWGGSFTTREARGTSGAPAAVVTGNQLGYFAFQGWNGASWAVNSSATGTTSYATENWTPAANGSNLVLYTTPNGATLGSPRLTIDQAGSVGIGTMLPLAKLHVLGNANVSTPNAVVGGSGLMAGDGTGRLWIGASGGNTYIESGPAADSWGPVNCTGATINPKLFFTGCNGNASVFYFNGKVGIGTQTPAFPLEVAGTVQATSFVYPSDERLKKNITTVDGYDLVRKMRGVEFQWRDSGKDDLGLIAQEVEKVAPNLVVTSEKGLKSVKYANIVALLIEAVKTQDQHIQKLHDENRELVRRLEALEASEALR